MSKLILFEKSSQLFCFNDTGLPTPSEKSIASTTDLRFQLRLKKCKITMNSYMKRESLNFDGSNLLCLLVET